MDVGTQTISFSLEELPRASHTITTLLEKWLNHTPQRPAFAAIRHASTVLFIDVDASYAHHLTQPVARTGYRVFQVKDALEAYTLFLQDKFIPCAIVLGREKHRKHLFFHRLLQQIEQRYQWKLLIISLQLSIPALNAPVFPPLSLSQSSTSMPFSSSPITAKLPDTLIPSTPITTPLSSEPSPTPAPPSTPSTTQPLSAPRVKEPLLLVGQNLGRYQIDMHVGSSPHSKVYKAYDRLRQEHYALKAIQTDSIPFSVLENSLEETTLFQREAELLNQFKHPHLLPVITCGTSYISGSPFIYKTMPYCPHRSLAHWLSRQTKQKNNKTLTKEAKDLVTLLQQLADALQYLHSAGVVYQNFKQSNLLILNQASSLRDMHLVLSDFTLLPEGSERPTTPDALLYLAPERWDGISLPTSDQYSLAAIAYELLTGRPPFQATAERTLQLLHTTKQPKPPTEINPLLPPTVNDVLLHALSKNPDQRFPNISLFALTLLRCWN